MHVLMYGMIVCSVCMLSQFTLGVAVFQFGPKGEIIYSIDLSALVGYEDIVLNLGYLRPVGLGNV